MANVLQIVVTIAVVCYTNGLTIKEIIDKRDELVTLKEYMKDLAFYKNDLASGGQKAYTFFAPHNSAFKNIPSQKQTRYNSQYITSAAKEELNIIFQYHAAYNHDYINDVYVTYTTDEMGNLKLTSSADGTSPSLFFRTLGDEHFVNGARILPDGQNIQADNGIVHIIDTFLYEQPIATNALKFVQNHLSGSDKSMRYSLFADLLHEYEVQMARQFPGDPHAEDVLNGQAPMTLFLPSDEALEKLSPNKRRELKDDFTKLQGVIESHVIKQGAYHTGVLTHVDTVPAIGGEVQVGSYLGRVYVSNNCAKGSITKANITVNNGAVHVIDGVLGYVYSDIYDTLEEYNDLNDFYLLVRGVTSVTDLIDISDTVTDVAEEDLYTMFAPISSGMTNSDFYGDASRERRVVQMHMLRGRLELASMTASLPHVPTLEPGQSARFYQVDNDGTFETYVQVNYVRSKILDGDICVKNGIVHTVDHIVGLPTTTIFEYIERTDDLSSLFQAVRETGMDTVLKEEDRMQTFMAPSNKAFEQMGEHSEGSKLRDRSNRQYLRNVMHRQLLSGVYIFDAMVNSDQSVVTEFNNEKISMSRSGSEYFILFDNRRIPVRVADLRMKNGMLHVIEEVLFSYSPGASEWISAASHVTLSHDLYYLILASVLFMANLVRAL